MRKIAIVAGCAVLAACGETETPPAEEAPADVVEVSVAADGGPSVGTYEVTVADGSVHTYVANEDGTYTSTEVDGTVTTGTWRQDGPNRWCDTEDGGEEVCRTEVVDENGIYTSTAENDPEDTVVVVRVEA